jgi:hypothetical protein
MQKGHALQSADLYLILLFAQSVTGAICLIRLGCISRFFVIQYNFLAVSQKIILLPVLVIMPV